MRAETQLFKDKIEVSLDGKQVFYLFFGGAIIASLVFVLGVMVGKRVEARAHAGAERAASRPEDPLAALDRLGRSDARSFRSALIQGEDDPRYDLDIAVAAAAADKRPAAADKRPAAADKRPREPARKRAENKPNRQRPVKPARPEPKPARPQPHKPHGPDEKPTAKPRPDAPDQKPAAARPAAHEPETPDADETSQPAPAPAAAAAGRDDASGESDDAAGSAARAPRFTLQLSSFQDRAEADSFFDKLKSAGYAPYIIEAEVPQKGLWYRVRLGAFQTYDQALDAKREFENSQHIIAYVTRLDK